MAAHFAYLKAQDVNPSALPAYAPTWNSATMVASPDHPPLVGDFDVEVCVVGAGLAGLTTARELARRGWSVAVLEAQRIAWNASGRNTGFVLPGFAQDMNVVARRVGLEQTKKLWALSEAGLEYVRNAINETDLPGVEPVEYGWLKVSKFDNPDEDTALVRLLTEEFGAEVEIWPVDRVRSQLMSEHYFQAVYYPTAFHINPLNYALGLAAAAEAAGVRIFEGTPVLALDADGVRKRITTPSARLRASHVVLAGNVHLGQVMPRLSGTLLPVWTYVATTAPLGRRLEDAIRFAGTVSDTDVADNHYKIVGGDRLMWSGGMTTAERNPRRFAAQLAADLKATYPQLGAVEFEHIWTGVLGNTLHRMPQIGELSPRVWVASGFGGHGLNTTAMAGDLVARAIADGDDTWRLFLPFDLVWAGGSIGRAVAQVNYWWYRKRELYKARQSREREKERRRVAVDAARRAWEDEPQLAHAILPPTPVAEDAPSDANPEDAAAEQAATQSERPVSPMAIDARAEELAPDMISDARQPQAHADLEPDAAGTADMDAEPYPQPGALPAVEPDAYAGAEAEVHPQADVQENADMVPHVSHRRAGRA